jgi:F0F1-type ATP synthase assembly protein I
VAFPQSKRKLQALVISTCAVTAMATPFWVTQNLAEGESAGSGLFAAWIPFAVAAILAGDHEARTLRDSRATADLDGSIIKNGKIQLRNQWVVIVDQLS